jgi:hypothetical protein
MGDVDPARSAFLGLHRSGYVVESYGADDGATVLTLSLRSHAGADVTPAVRIYSDQPVDASRAQLFLESICRFRNAGGDIVAMLDLVKAFLDATSVVGSPLPSIQPHDGLHLLGVRLDGNYERFYQADGVGLLRVVDGCFTEEISHEYLSCLFADHADGGTETQS